MQLNDFIAVQFPQEPGKSYFAIVTKTLPDNTFECRFVHSGSRYTFKTYSGWLEVVNSTGAFKPGTKTNNVQLFTESTTDHLNVGVNVRVTFDDGNGYLGVITSATGGFEVRFLHSGNIYQFDTEGVAHHAGSPYDGRKALEFKPYTAGKSLFAGTTDSTISFDIKNEMNGQRMSGELEVTIKRTDTEEVLYSNQYLYADDAAARDKISLGVQEGQNLLILVDYHPAKEPYTTHPTSSPDIDRETTISGSQIFSYKKVSELLFRVDIQNEVTSVTATSGTQIGRASCRERVLRLV